MDIGDTYHGGQVAFIDGRDLYIISKDTFSGSYGCSGSFYNAVDYGIGYGSGNTYKYSDGCASSASRTAVNSSYSGYTDWWLPNREEYFLMSNGARFNYYLSYTDASNPFKFDQNQYITSEERTADFSQYYQFDLTDIDERPQSVNTKSTSSSFKLIRFEANALPDKSAIVLNNIKKNPMLRNDKYIEIFTPKIGDRAYGGIIAYVDQTSKHGLIVAEENVGTLFNSTLYSSMNAVDKTVHPFGATGWKYGTGQANTNAIFTSYQYLAPANPTVNPVIFQVTGYTGGGYTDWFIPSVHELFYICKANSISPIPNFISGSRYYWSSTQFVGSLGPTLWPSFNCIRPDIWKWMGDPITTNSISNGPMCRPCRYF